MRSFRLRSLRMPECLRGGSSPNRDRFRPYKRLAECQVVGAWRSPLPSSGRLRGIAVQAEEAVDRRSLRSLASKPSRRPWTKTGLVFSGMGARTKEAAQARKLEH